MSESKVRKVVSVQNGDEIVLKGKVIDARDTGNIVVAVGNEQFTPSVQDITGAHVEGGRVSYVTLNKKGEEVACDRFGYYDDKDESE